MDDRLFYVPLQWRGSLAVAREWNRNFHSCFSDSAQKVDPAEEEKSPIIPAGDGIPDRPMTDEAAALAGAAFPFVC